MRRDEAAAMAVTAMTAMAMAAAAEADRRMCDSASGTHGKRIHDYLRTQTLFS